MDVCLPDEYYESCRTVPVPMKSRHQYQHQYQYLVPLLAFFCAYSTMVLGKANDGAAFFN